MKAVFLELTFLEVVFIITTIVSLFFNFFQFAVWWRDRKNLYQPISNNLVGLFNDIKAKTAYAYTKQQLHYSKTNPHKEINTLRWEFADFNQTVISYLQGFQESVVALILSLNPKDRLGFQAFRATEYGLTDEEKKMRQDWMEHSRRQQIVAQENTNRTLDPFG
jgi:hypothetical protein